MKSVSLFNLKQQLTRFANDVVHGEDVLVTKYNKPLFRMTSTRSPNIHVGKKFGQRPLPRYIKSSPQLGQMALRYLLEDREDDE